MRKHITVNNIKVGEVSSTNNQGHHWLPLVIIKLDVETISVSSLGFASDIFPKKGISRWAVEESGMNLELLLRPNFSKCR